MTYASEDKKLVFNQHISIQNDFFLIIVIMLSIFYSSFLPSVYRVFNNGACHEREHFRIVDFRFSVLLDAR